ncbi:MAG: hypothetical protein ACJ8MO_24345, partial [Bacillus sp. (in: firmicutes)]
MSLESNKIAKERDAQVDVGQKKYILKYLSPYTKKYHRIKDCGSDKYYTFLSFKKRTALIHH